jgi:hypothetical protein
MRTAILMLACSDYEAMEVALACHGAYLPPETPFFILQNCRGTYDSERTLMAARRFERLYPGRVIVIDDIPPGPAYRTIATLLASSRFQDIDLVCKVDDDAFPLAAGWLEELQKTYLEAEARGGSIAYSTPLINNNTWGFAECLDVLDLHEAYVAEAAIRHKVGSGDAMNPIRILEPSEIFTGANGTIWAYPHIARWLHERTTLAPDRFIAGTAGLSVKPIPSGERYSIGCILFRKELWAKIDDGGTDDEHMLHQYCRARQSSILCARSVPFVHFAYFSQREENRDIVPRARELYEKRLNLPYPIAMRTSREFEIEARLRWLEGQGLFAAPPTGNGAIGTLGGLTPEQFAVRALRGLSKAALRKLGLGRG